MKTFFIIAITLTLSWACRADNNVLSPYGYGVIQVGMALNEVKSPISFNHTNKERSYNTDNECQTFTLNNHPKELAVMVLDGIIERISVYEDVDNHKIIKIITDTGLRVGDSAALVHKLYPIGLSDEPHEYLGSNARYLTWWNEDKNRGIRFETGMDNRITAIHAGSDAIFLLEGCS